MCTDAARYIVTHGSPDDPDITGRACPAHLEPVISGLLEYLPASLFQVGALNVSADFPCEYAEPQFLSMPDPPGTTRLAIIRAKLGTGAWPAQVEE
jgi:hypothetical protein